MSIEGNRNVKNAAFSLGEYAVMPLLYLAATPILVKRLGLDHYGLWMLINSLVGMASALDFGFGDSTLRFVSMHRGRGQSASIVRGIRTAYWVTIPIGVFAGSLMFFCAPFVASIVFNIPAELYVIAEQSLELGAALVALRVIESVFVGVVRGYERYDVAALMSVATRGTVVLSALLLVIWGLGLREVLIASVAISFISLVVQGEIVRVLTQASPWMPSIDKGELKRMFGFGLYAWIQAAASLIFNHADRMLIGALLGMSVLGVYSVCLQVAQQIHGIVGAGFSVLFPTTSRCMEMETAGNLLTGAKNLIMLNFIISLALAAPVVLFSDSILSFWMSHDFAQQAASVLRLLGGAFFIMSINVAVYFILLGAGDVKFLAFTGIMGGAICLMATIVFIPVAGINAAAGSRFMYAAIAVLNFVRLGKVLR